MNTSGPWLAVSGMALAVATAACFLALAAWTDNRAMQRQITDLQEQRRAAIDTSRESDRQRQDAEQALALQRDQTAQVQAQLSELRAQSTAADPAPSPGERRAVRARVFAGQQALGDAWVLKGGTATNEFSPMAEPVVLLDASILRVLRAAVAREEPPPATPREVTVNYNYPTYTPYTGWWPAWYVWTPSDPTNGPPTDPKPQPPKSPTAPSAGNTGQSGIWRPTEKPFLPSPSSWPIVTPPRATTQPVIRQPVTQPSVRPAPQPMPRQSPVQPRSPTPVIRANTPVQAR